jgi:homoserine kinase type II
MSESMQLDPAVSLLPAGALDRVRQAYDIGEWLDWRRTPKGTANVSLHVVATSGRYVLRCSNDRKSEASMRFEMRLIDYLRQHGYPVPAVIPTRTGDAYFDDGGRFYLLTGLIVGGPYDTNNPRHLTEAARGLGWYHRLVRSFPEPHLRAARALDDLGLRGVAVLGRVQALAEGLLNGEELQSLKQIFAFLCDRYESVQQALVQVCPGLDQLVVQSSYGRSALIYDGDELAGVVDYDRAAVDLRGMDLAYTLKAFCRERMVGFNYERCRDFVAAYREEDSLSEKEALALPLLFKAQRLLKVMNKCSNLLNKQALVAQAAKDAQKVAMIAGREVDRLRWLEKHGSELAGVFLEGA